MKNYTELVRKYRFDKRLSMEDFSKLIQVSTMTVYRWEYGKAQPCEATRIKIDKLIESNREETHGNIMDLLESVERNMQKVVEEIKSLKEWLST